MELDSAIKYLTFFSDDRKFAVSFDDIKVVEIARDIKEIPEYPEYFAGSVIWQDKFIPVIDCRKRFGFKECEYTNKSCIIICNAKYDIRGKVDYIGILTDTVSDVYVVEHEEIMDCEAVNDEAFTRYLKGVFIKDDIQYYIIDPSLMVNETDTSVIKV